MNKQKGGNHQTSCDIKCFNQIKKLINENDKNLKSEMTKYMPFSSKQINDFLQIAFKQNPKQYEKTIKIILDISYNQFIFKSHLYKFLKEIVLYENSFKQVIDNYKILKLLIKFGGVFQVVDEKLYNKNPNQKNIQDKSNLIVLLILTSTQLKIGEKKKLGKLILDNWSNRLKDDTIEYLNQLKNIKEQNKLMKLIMGEKPESKYIIKAKPQLIKPELEASKPRKLVRKQSPLARQKNKLSKFPETKDEWLKKMEDEFAYTFGLK